MLNFIVKNAARLIATGLNGLAERIERAHSQVLKTQAKSRRGTRTTELKKKPASRPDSYRPQVMAAEVGQAVLAKMNLGRSKDLQHHIPTSRHS